MPRGINADTQYNPPPFLSIFLMVVFNQLWIHLRGIVMPTSYYVYVNKDIAEICGRVHPHGFYFWLLLKHWGLPTSARQKMVESKGIICDIPWAISSSNYVYELSGNQNS